MNQYANTIVTTTINPPTEATKKFSEMPGWNLIVVGDLKTPHEEYKKLNCIYLDPETQEDKYPTLSKLIGWNSIQRRNLGFIEAFNRGAEIIASVDDDNIPLPNWGKNVFVGKTIECDLYISENGVFDPLSVTNSSHLWHRGYPIEFLNSRHKIKNLGKSVRKVLVQADLWNGDPDIDAIARINFRPEVEFSEILRPFCSSNISPFNSQNTFLAREVFPVYSVLPFIGRMDDIWASYILQYHFPDCVAYNQASVYQARNPQDLVTNLENEIFGYRNTLNLLNNLSNYNQILPENTVTFIDEYIKCFKI
jgi:hypothetical protein